MSEWELTISAFIPKLIVSIPLDDSGFSARRRAPSSSKRQDSMVLARSRRALLAAEDVRREDVVP